MVGKAWSTVGKWLAIPITVETDKVPEIQGYVTAEVLQWIQSDSTCKPKAMTKKKLTRRAFFKVK